MALTYVKSSGLDPSATFAFANVSLSGNIVPISNNVSTLGDPTHVFKDVYIGPGSLYIDGSKVLEASGQDIVVTADTNQNLRVVTTGSGDIELDPTGSGVISIKGPLQFEAGTQVTSSDGNAIAYADPISVDALGSLTANTDLTLTGNGTGLVKVDDDLIVTGNITVQGTSGNLSVTTLSVQDNIIDISAETIGTPSSNAGLRVIRGDDPSVQIRWNETSDAWQITNDGTTYLNIVGTDSAANISSINYITANYFSGNGSFLTGVTSSTVTTNAQPNITSVGTLSSVTVTGLTTATGGVKTANILDTSGTITIQTKYNTNAGDVGITGNLVVGAGGTGNITATYLIGNGSTLTHITGSNVDGQVSNSLVAGTVYTNAQPNITSVGTLTSVIVSTTANVGTLNATDGAVSGNVVISGNLTVSGTTEYTNVTNLYVKDPIIEMGGAANGAALSSNDGKDRGSLLHYYTTAPVDAFMGWDNSNGEFAFGSNVSLSSEVVTFNTFGNVRASTFIGALSGAATTAATVTTNAQPNITSIGTLTSLSVTANITSGNINGGNAIVANYFVGDGSLLTGLPASYANSNVASYLPTYSGNLTAANVAFTGSNVSLGAVDNLHITGGTANYVLQTDGAGTLSWAAQTGGGGSTSTTITVDNFTGNGVQTSYTLSVTPTSINSVFVNYNGTFVGRGSYSLSGATLTFGSVPANGASIEITTIQGLTISSGAFTTRTATGDGSETDYTVTNGAIESSVLVTLDGVLQTPTTDYTISETTLSFITAPATGVAIQIRELSVASSSGSMLTVKDEGSNLSNTVTSIDFVGGGVTATNTGSNVTVTIPSAAITVKDEGTTLTSSATSINFVGSVVTATNVGGDVTVTVSGTSNTSIRAQAMTMGIIFGG